MSEEWRRLRDRIPPRLRPFYTLMLILYFIWIAVLFAILLTSCGNCLQVRPSCSVEPHARIEFVNYAKVDKFSFVQRIYDGEPLGEPITYVVKPKTRHIYKVPPGIYEFGVKLGDGTYKIFQTRNKDLTWHGLRACETVVINMSFTSKKPKKVKKIRSRRGVQ